jgi:UDP-GlcNAc:undecaprenyl-phosphate GlcNAc-1-phosphate transferase
MNAVNLLDGLDGLAAGVCLFVCVTLFLVGMIFGQPLTMVLTACLSGAILGFLVFNFHPASIFLGDSGSILLGFLVGALSLLGTSGAHAGVTQLIPVIALGLPLFDTALAVVRRWSRKLPLSAADRQHIHHALMAIGLSHRRVVLILYAACVALGAAALLITVEQAEVTLLVLGSLGVVGFVCARLFGGLRLGDLWGRVASDFYCRQRSAEARVTVERAVARLRAAASADELWEAALEAIQGLGFDCATLRLYDSPDAAPTVFAWPERRSEPLALMELEPDLWSARLRVLTTDNLSGELEVSNAVQDGPLLAEAPELLDRVRREMAMRIGDLDFGEAEVAWRPPAPISQYDSSLASTEEAAG